MSHITDIPPILKYSTLSKYSTLPKYSTLSKYSTLYRSLSRLEHLYDASLQYDPCCSSQSLARPSYTVLALNANKSLSIQYSTSQFICLRD